MIGKTRRMSRLFVGEKKRCLLSPLDHGGWLGPVLPPLAWFLIKTFAVIAFFVLLRASLPRPRYDQLIAYGWKVMLPLTLVNLLITGAVLLARA